MIFDLFTRQLYHTSDTPEAKALMDADEDSEGGLVSRITLKRNGTLKLEVLLQNSNGHNIQTSEFTCKKKEEYATTPVLRASTANGATLHILELAASTKELDALLGIGTASQTGKVTLMGEFVVVIDGKHYASINPVSVVILNDISRPDEGEPNPGTAWPLPSEIPTLNDIDAAVNKVMQDLDLAPTPDATTVIAGKVKLASNITAADTGAASGQQVFDHVNNKISALPNATASAKGIASFPASGGLSVVNGAASVNVGDGLEMKNGKVCARPIELPPGVGEIVIDSAGNIILETPYVDGISARTPGIQFVNKSTNPEGYTNILRTDGDGRPEISGFGYIAFDKDIPNAATFATKAELAAYAPKSNAVFGGTRPKFNATDLALATEIPDTSGFATRTGLNGFSGTNTFSGTLTRVTKANPAANDVMNREMVDSLLSSHIDAMPVGTVLQGRWTAPPVGTIEYAGQTLWSNQYPRLYTLFTGLNPPATPVQFTIEDAREHFLRSKGGSRIPGSTQLDSVQNFNGGITLGGMANASLIAQGAYGILGFSDWQGIGNPRVVAQDAVSPTNPKTMRELTVDASSQIRTSAETRPKNIALLTVIKY